MFFIFIDRSCYVWLFRVALGLLFTVRISISSSLLLNVLLLHLFSIGLFSFIVFLLNHLWHDLYYWIVVPMDLLNLMRSNDFLWVNNLCGCIIIQWEVCTEAYLTSFITRLSPINWLIGCIFLLSRCSPIYSLMFTYFSYLMLSENITFPVWVLLYLFIHWFFGCFIDLVKVLWHALVRVVEGR